jgi:hypothetical protein
VSGEVRDDFAAAQFLRLADDERLSRPSFEPFRSGLSLSFGGYETDDLAAAEATPFDYRLTVVDSGAGAAPERVELDPELAVRLIGGAPAAAAAVRVAPPAWTTADPLDAWAATAPVRPTYTEAAQADSGRPVVGAPEER